MNTHDLSSHLHTCRLCPRNCGVDRASGALGYCGAPGVPRAARADLLLYEEPCLTGQRGSGAVFFTGCSLGCIFCQNAEIAHLSKTSDPGVPVDPGKLTEVFLQLQAQGAATLNLVTATPSLTAVVPALIRARDEGLTIPVVYNSSGYEKVDVLKALEGLIDIYLPDIKYMDASLAAEFSKAADYPEVAVAAIDEMVRQRPNLRFADGSCALPDEGEIPPLLEGVLIRHLALPGCAEDTLRIMRTVKARWGLGVLFSLMNQYTPMPAVQGHPCLGRPLSFQEYDALVDACLAMGLTNSFIQEGGTVSESFIPAFDGTGLT